MADAGAPAAPPRAAASVLLVRPGRPRGVEVYMIRRQPTMRFLGGFFAFPGGRVDAVDAETSLLGRCRGLDPAEADRVLGVPAPPPAIAFWVAAARELLEETGVLVGRDEAGASLGAPAPGVVARIEGLRRRLMGGESLAALLAEAHWYLDLEPFRYLSHFITPASSPIRFTARFFLAPLPPGQEPRLFTEETSEGFWTHPAEAVARGEAGEMPMAEPAESGLRYLAEFPDLDTLWVAHADRRHKFHGINDRLFERGFPGSRRERRGKP